MCCILCHQKYYMIFCWFFKVLFGTIYSKQLVKIKAICCKQSKANLGSASHNLSSLYLSCKQKSLVRFKLILRILLSKISLHECWGFLIISKLTTWDIKVTSALEGFCKGGTSNHCFHWAKDEETAWNFHVSFLLRSYRIVVCCYQFDFSEHKISHHVFQLKFGKGACSFLLLQWF